MFGRVFSGFASCCMERDALDEKDLFRTFHFRERRSPVGWRGELLGRRGGRCTIRRELQDRHWCGVKT